MQSKEKFIYMKMYTDIKEKIETSFYKKGVKLPTESELQKIYSVSRDTTRKVLALLEEQGYVERKVAKGTFVKDIKSVYNLTKLEGFTEQMIDRGYTPSSKLVSLKILNDKKKIASILGLLPDDKVIEICRIRKADNRPMAYEIAYLPYNKFNGIENYVGDDSSLYDIYENIYNYKLHTGNMSLEAQLPKKEIAKALEIPHTNPVLTMNCTVVNTNDEPLYHVICYYVGDKYEFFLTLKR